MTTKTKNAHALVSYFVKCYKDKYDRKAMVNRYSARWGMESILEDLTYEEGTELIDYYFGTISPTGHTIEWFLYNYDKLAVAMEATNEDRAALARIREDTRRRTEAWRLKNGIN